MSDRKLRYPVIYEPAGRAKEYGELAANLYTGCDHGCVYCFAPDILRMKRDVFNRPQRRAGVLERIASQAEQYAGREVFLCFTCDPYQYLDRKYGHTRDAIEILNNAGVAVNLLTKGGLTAARDFDLLVKNKGNRIGATLTFINNADSLLWEPRAALPHERVEMLKIANKFGINTWASLEPVIDPRQTIEIIHATKGFVDEYKVGRWNHDARANDINWKKFGLEAIAVLKKHGKRYYIKKDLAEAMK